MVWHRYMGSRVRYLHALQACHDVQDCKASAAEAVVKVGHCRAAQLQHAVNGEHQHVP